jgi:hypothetical protein
MKIVLNLILIFMIPSFLLAHPGKTDYRGGHKCWKNCNQWDLARSEYHLHDRQGETIRVGEPVKTVQPKSVSVPGKPFLQEESPEQPEASVPAMKQENEPDKRIVVEKHETLTVYQKSYLSFYSILMFLLAFLLLILLVFVRKRNEKN